ncbi:hypothetical protein [Methylorubrum suomiense]|uniref:hypothetical protein n=1 Tax=Methylorubrum suomiense TaxID=144191 RepID=UPI001EE29E3A|nr:hypothetical protein [Methylorubrum suomiense]
MQYHKRRRDNFVQLNAKASFPIREASEDLIMPIDASMLTAERMMAASEAKRRVELKKTQNA